VLNAIWYPAFTGLTPQIVKREHLQSANSILGVGGNLAFTIGSAIAGMVVAAVGSGWAIMADAVSFFIAGLLVFSLRHLDRVPTDTSEENHGILHDLREGWTEFSSRFWIVITVVSFAFYQPAFEGFLAVIAPVQAKEAMDGSRSMGFMLAGWGIGGILGTLVALQFRVRRPLLLACGVMPAASLWMFSLVAPSPLWVAIIAAVIAGVVGEVFYANWLTTLQTHVPEESMSRVGAYDAFGSLVLAPVGLFLAGPFTNAVGTRTAIVTAGMMVVVATSVPLLSREVRTLERRDLTSASS
jgi:predicted MFS family arabinose efflux permease